MEDYLFLKTGRQPSLENACLLRGRFVFRNMIEIISLLNLKQLSLTA